MSRICLSIAAMALSLTVWALPCAARPLQLEDYLQWEYVENPQISPDGKTILYYRSHVNATEDRIDSELWAMDAAGGQNRRLMQGVGEVQWSPDGTRIAYIDSTERGPELFVRGMNGEGRITQVTHGGMHPFNLSWSPDGRSVAFLANVPGKAQWTITLPEKPQSAHWTGDATVIDSFADTLRYRQSDLEHSPGGYTHVFIVSASGGEPRQVTHGAWNAEPRLSGTPWGGRLAWTPDGRSILFSADRAQGMDSESELAQLQAVDLSDGRIHALSQAKGYWGVDPGARVSPDGKRVAYVGRPASYHPDLYFANELHITDIDGRNDRTLLQDVPGIISFLEWTDDSQALTYVAEKEGSRNLYRVSLNGALKAVTQGEQSLYLSSVSKNGIGVAVVSTAQQPGYIVRFRIADGGGWHALLASNRDLLKDVQLGRVEEIWYPSTDGKKVQAWMIYPPEYSAHQKYPLILQVHGGPTGMSGPNFDFRMQEMAAQGYIVLVPNFRGSTGYGAAFSNAVYSGSPGQLAIDDLLSGIDAAVAQGAINTERLYAEGCSFGGYLTALLIGRTDRFAAATASCSMADWISMAGTVGAPGWVYKLFDKPFWEDPAPWLAASPMMQIARVKTPTLVMTGENDSITPVSQSQELYMGLKMADVPAKMILMKDEGHGPWNKPSNMLRTQLYMRKWYGEWRRAMQGSKPVWRHDESAQTP